MKQYDDMVSWQSHCSISLGMGSWIKSEPVPVWGNAEPQSWRAEKEWWVKPIKQGWNGVRGESRSGIESWARKLGLELGQEWSHARLEWSDDWCVKPMQAWSWLKPGLWNGECQLQNCLCYSHFLNILSRQLSPERPYLITLWLE